MKRWLLAVLLLVTSACSVQREKLAWRVRQMALAPTPLVGLEGRNREILVTLSTRTVQRLLLAHIRIARAAGIQAELVIVEGEEPNAFAGLMKGRRVIAINTAMVTLIGDDIDEYAALLGHETAHWAKGHVDSGQNRATTLHGIGTLVGLGLGMAGVPAAGTITGLAVDLINASYSRDEEREADAAGIDYMVSAGFDPEAAIRLHKRMLKASRGSPLPFLSSHPSGRERIENLTALIQAKKSPPSP